MAITRETQQPGKPTSKETAFYVTNATKGRRSRRQLLEDCAQAVRRHWSVESNNWVRDVTLGEDRQHTKDRKLAQILALLRSLTLSILRRVGGNLRAAIERFSLTPGTLAHHLKAIKFL